jgi:hypothetical protein
VRARTYPDGKKQTTTTGEYAKIVAYPIYDEIPVDALGEELGGRPRVLGMIGQLRNSPRIYERLMSDGYADDEIPLWVVRPSAERVDPSVERVDPSVERVDPSVERTLDADELRSDALDPDVQRSAVLRSAITPKRSTNSIPRYPGQQSRAEQNAFQRSITRSNGVQRTLISC